MKNFFKISRISFALVMSIFLFSCEKSEMDSLIPAANAEASAVKKGVAPSKKIVITPQAPQTADTAYIITFYDANNQLTTQTQVENLATSIGGTITFDQVYFEFTKGFAAALTVTQANAFRNDSRVEFVEVDGPIVP